MFIFDIETRAYDEEALKAICPPFDPEEHVSYGNTKDEAKRKIIRDNAEANHFPKFAEKAALHAATATVLVIGYYDASKCIGTLHAVDDDGKVAEDDLLRQFWKLAESCRKASRPLVGFNIHDFDLPFLLRRSWICDVPAPGWVMTNDRYWADVFVDLRKKWLAGQKPAEQKSNFDYLGSVFGTGGKPEGITGADFARLWKTNRDQAKSYLLGEIKQPAEWARKMGVV